MIAQAAIPVTVLGLFNYIDANQLKPADLNKDKIQWLTLIFADKNFEIVSHVAEYAGSTMESTKHEMEFILKETVRLIKELNSDDAPLHGFTVQHKAEALLYLPVSLHAGIILGNNNLDDNTNKMEGPVSNLMHNIEKRFK